MDIKTHQRRRIGYLTLDKPATLNALTESMIDELTEGLQGFESDDSVEAVVINSSSSRAFCAGGDMKRIRELSLSNDKEAIDSFFEKEYALNLAIAECSKPFIAIIDGVAMGGGLGLSVHGSHRIVTERAVMAMPETRIGFFPDVGGSFFLPTLVANAGRWLAMTAAPVRSDETVLVGLGTHFITSTHLENLLLELENSDTVAVSTIIENMSETCSNPEFLELLEHRSRWFSHQSVGDIQAALQQAQPSNEDAAYLLKLLNEASPYSITTTLNLFANTQGLALEECLKHEKTASMEAAFHPDFIEGVRAVLVDKDRNPRWQSS